MLGDDLAQPVQIGLGRGGQARALVGDPADRHRLVRVQRHGDDLLVVEVAVVDAGAHRVAVQTDDEVEDRGPVGHVDLLGGVLRPDRLLGEEEAALLALFELDERIGLQVLHRHPIPSGQRIVA